MNKLVVMFAILCIVTLSICPVTHSIASSNETTFIKVAETDWLCVNNVDEFGDPIEGNFFIQNQHYFEGTISDSSKKYSSW